MVELLNPFLDDLSLDFLARVCPFLFLSVRYLFCCPVVIEKPSKVYLISAYLWEAPTVDDLSPSPAMDLGPTLAPPPSYTPPSEISLPAYCEQHGSNEQTLAMVPLAPTSSAGPADYEYSTKHMSLNLGRRTYGTNMPCYGRNSVLQARLTVKSFKYVKEVSYLVSALWRSGSGSESSLTRTTIDLGQSYHDRQRSGFSLAA